MLRPRPRAADLAFAALAALLALGLKAFYSRAGAAELGFILAPSCWIAAHVGGLDLVAERGAGFVSHADRMVVGPACAGVNFLVIAFLAVYLSRLLVAAAVAYAATIVTNGLRIILAAHLFRFGGIGWLTPERIHRLAGVVIYCVSLAILCRAVAPGPRSLVIAFACYLGVAIVVPLLNGAARNRLFVEHTLVVTSATLLLLVAAVRSRTRPRPEAASRGPNGH